MFDIFGTFQVRQLLTIEPSLPYLLQKYGKKYKRSPTHLYKLIILIDLNMLEIRHLGNKENGGAPKFNKSANAFGGFKTIPNLGRVEQNGNIG